MRALMVLVVLDEIGVRRKLDVTSRTIDGVLDNLIIRRYARFVRSFRARARMFVESDRRAETDSTVRAFSDGYFV